MKIIRSNDIDNMKKDRRIMDNKTFATTTSNILTVLLFILIGLKVFHIIHCSWFVILAPLWCPMLLVMFVLIVASIRVVLASFQYDRMKK